MTSTPVADVSTYFANYASAKTTGSGNDNASHFQDVLKQQTGSRAADADTKQVRTENSHAGRDKIGNKEFSVKTEKGSSLQDKTEMTEEEIAQAVEEAAAMMLVKTAQELNMTVGEVEALLKELNLETTDILNPDTIPALVLKAAGGTDMMELITNQDLSASVKALSEELQALNGTLMQETGLSQEELAQFSENLTGMENAGLQEAAAENGLAVSDEETDGGKMSRLEQEQGAGQEEQASEITVVKKTSAKGQQESGLNQKQEHNPFVQNLNTAEAVLNKTATVGETFTGNFRTQVMNQIMDYMNVALQPDLTELEMQLHPESLGKVNVHISAREGVITAQFTTQNETVKAVLESQMIQLKESFTQQGIKVEAVEVTVENHGFERSMDQSGQGGAGGQEEKKSRPRRLQMDMLQDTEITELPEEEQIAVRMMQQNGNTVDYTA